MTVHKNAWETQRVQYDNKCAIVVQENKELREENKQLKKFRDLCQNQKGGIR